MRTEPTERIAVEAVNAWRLSAHLISAIAAIVTIGVFVASHFLDFIPGWVGWTLAGFTIIEWVITAYVVPKLRWRRWRYQIYEQEIYIQHGIIIVTRTVIPMIRVQHVDTKQGPILKRYGLSNLEISTAATTHEIPALSEEQAADLRDQISELARVEQDDV
ncbi:hypothetical protein GGQ92_000940 [Gracilibacillus halotolerans]|uniref:YdbS-like PH domain-containing protein n=1 Tax=Gracilibacillus halotolerans TaxID=74386 RepID=A0A841RI58_9BACI|nr:PH domain-containing protein [Gracilibacillus halotolerans]MBB6512159.1 hypothetical protein [Gracilibacillus halotolerans]